ncbi:hypothetical protein LBR04_22310 [Levilactobacillus brevis]|nr:hypothetical protein LBR04_22310 [Levilactobacillus brevis]
MDEKRMTLTIMADVQNFDDIEGPLPQIAALRKNYYVDLTISCPVPSKDQSILQSYLREKNSSERH